MNCRDNFCITPPGVQVKLRKDDTTWGFTLESNKRDGLDDSYSVAGLGHSLHSSPEAVLLRPPLSPAILLNYHHLYPISWKRYGQKYMGQGGRESVSAVEIL